MYHDTQSLLRVAHRAESDDRTYKLLFMDVGLMNHVCGLDGPSIDAMDAVRLVNEGGIAEQYVGQQLATFGAGEAAPGLTTGCGTEGRETRKWTT